MIRIEKHMLLFRQIRKHLTANRSVVEAFRNRHLHSIISHAYHNVKYYRQIFDKNGIGPEDIQTVEDLAVVPITTVNDFKKIPIEDFTSIKARSEKLVRGHTSGSSGRPFVFMRAPYERQTSFYFRYRNLKMLGVKTSDKVVELGRPLPLSRTNMVLDKIRKALRIYRIDRIDVFDSDVNAIIEQLNKIKPDVVFGYPTVMSKVAQHLTAKKRRFSPRFVVAVAEAMNPFARKKISEGFGCSNIYELYGAAECLHIACTCPVNGGYHICDDNVVVEILKDGQPVKRGEQGEVVVTALHNYATPFIRYSLGDIATRGANVCACGRPFSTIESIQGRKLEYFEMPDGKQIIACAIMRPILDRDEGDWISQFRLIQQRRDLIILKIHPLVQPNERQIRNVQHLARIRLPQDVALKIEIVDEIPFEPSGKFLFYVPLKHGNGGGP